MMTSGMRSWMDTQTLLIIKKFSMILGMLSNNVQVNTILPLEMTGITWIIIMVTLIRMTLREKYGISIREIKRNWKSIEWIMSKTLLTLRELRVNAEEKTSHTICFMYMKVEVLKILTRSML
jgi:hypothetical protein